MASSLDDMLMPGERIVRRHKPNWYLNTTGIVVTVVVFAMMLAALEALKTEFGYMERYSLALVIVVSSIGGAILVPAMYYFGRSAIVTDRRILVRQGFSWSDAISMPLDEIEEIRISDGLMIVLSRGRKVAIPCWKWMAPRLVEAMRR